MDCDSTGWVSAINTWAQVLTVVAGVVITFVSFNRTRRTEAAARQAIAKNEGDARQYTAEKEAAASRIEAAKPFLELRQKLYTQAVQVAGILTNPSTHTEEEYNSAKKRFSELYVSELSMVEARDVEAKMWALANVIGPELTNFTPAQTAAYELSHALRDSFIADYGLQQ